MTIYLCNTDYDCIYDVILYHNKCHHLFLYDNGREIIEK